MRYAIEQPGAESLLTERCPASELPVLRAKARRLSKMYPDTSIYLLAFPDHEDRAVGQIVYASGYKSYTDGVTA